jgi:hypothetical protein
MAKLNEIVILVLILLAFAGGFGSCYYFFGMQEEKIKTVETVRTEYRPYYITDTVEVKLKSNAKELDTVLAHSLMMQIDSLQLELRNRNIDLIAEMDTTVDDSYFKITYSEIDNRFSNTFNIASRTFNTIQFIEKEADSDEKYLWSLIALVLGLLLGVGI